MTNNNSNHLQHLVPQSTSTNNNTNIPMKLSNLPLRPSTLSLLLRRGFTTTNDIEQSKQDGGIANFAAEVFGNGGNNNNNGSVDVKEAFRIIREVEDCKKRVLCITNTNKEEKNNKAGNSITAAAILLQNSSSPHSSATSGPRHIITFCRTIDSLLGGGFARSEVTEICGIPGIGKTQLGMQLCVDARLPRIYGGVQGEAVYIDSEGSFSPERCWSMSCALVDHVENSARKRRARSQQQRSHHGATSSTANLVPSWFNATTILSGIHVFRVHDETSQTCTIKNLEGFIRRRQEEYDLQQQQQQQQDQQQQNGVEEEKEKIAPIKIVVIDSIAFHYRSSLSSAGADYRARTRSLAEIASFLSHLATTFDIAVVAINQMTTKVGGGNNGDISIGGVGGGTTTAGGGVELNDNTKLVPALGESWAHATTTRLLLDFMPGSGTRCCRLVKSPHKAPGTALYDVTENGIRDVPPSSMPRQQRSNLMDSDASKRPRTHY